MTFLVLPCPSSGFSQTFAIVEATCFIFNLRLCQDLSVSQRGGSAPRSLRLRGRRQTLGAALKQQVHAALWGCKRGPGARPAPGCRRARSSGRRGPALGPTRRAAVGLWLGKPCSSASTQRPGWQSARTAAVFRVKARGARNVSAPVHQSQVEGRFWVRQRRAEHGAQRPLPCAVSRTPLLPRPALRLSAQVPRTQVWALHGLFLRWALAASLRAGPLRAAWWFVVRRRPLVSRCQPWWCSKPDVWGAPLRCGS